MLSRRLEVRIGSSISVSRTSVENTERNRFAVKTSMDEITTLLCQIIDKDIENGKSFELSKITRCIKRTIPFLFSARKNASPLKKKNSF